MNYFITALIFATENWYLFIS